ncbi:MAG: hypothetical protein WCB58_16355, partial [Acidobacteriaceae bacterium]
SQPETPGHAKEGSDDILEEKPVMQEIGKAANDLPWAGQQLARVSHNGYLPDRKQNSNESDWTKPNEQFQILHSPLLSSVKWLSGNRASASRRHTILAVDVGLKNQSKGLVGPHP